MLKKKISRNCHHWDTDIFFKEPFNESYGDYLDYDDGLQLPVSPQGGLSLPPVLLPYIQYIIYLQKELCHTLAPSLALPRLFRCPSQPITKGVHM